MGRRSSGSITLASAARMFAVGSDIVAESSAARCGPFGRERRSGQAATMRAGSARGGAAVAEAAQVVRRNGRSGRGSRHRRGGRDGSGRQHGGGWHGSRGDRRGRGRRRDGKRRRWWHGLRRQDAGAPNGAAQAAGPWGARAFCGGALTWPGPGVASPMQITVQRAGAALRRPRLAVAGVAAQVDQRHPGQRVGRRQAVHVQRQVRARGLRRSPGGRRRAVAAAPVSGGRSTGTTPVA